MPPTERCKSRAWHPTATGRVLTCFSATERFAASAGYLLPAVVPFFIVAVAALRRVS